MPVKVRIPTPLQKLTANQSEVHCEASSINAMLAELEKQHPGIKERICDNEGKLRRFVNIYVNEEDIRFLQGQDTPLKPGDDISIIPAIAGGARHQSVGGPAAQTVKKRVMLVFPPDQIKEPAVFTMAKKFDIMPNIRKARVTETVGEMTLELEGTEKNLQDGVKFLESRGIKVESVTGDSAR
ncbi:MAG: MoaD/ThiS family protein [Candidatus Omnitrophica bacterium]|nr:MoaD/ThiS family protein [Candidatus Omnitrophota bacterium]